MFMKMILFSSLDYSIAFCFNSLYSYFQTPHEVLGITRSRVSKEITLLYTRTKITRKKF